MNLDDEYNPAHRQAVDMQFKLHDYMGNNTKRYDPRATLLQHEMHHLVEDLEMKKNPRTVEDRIKAIQRQLQEERIHQDPIMAYEHIDDLHKHYDQMRQQVRRFSNY